MRPFDQTQHYAQLSARYTNEQIRDILALADMESLRTKGYGVRSLKEIERDALPCEGDLSDHSDMLIGKAVLAYEAGETIPALGGMKTEDLLAVMEELLDPNAMAVLRNIQSLEQAYLWFEKAEIPPNG